MTEKPAVIYLLTPVLAGLLYASNYLNPALFDSTEYLFALWFGLSFLTFMIGWQISRSAGWVTAARMLYLAVSAAAVAAAAYVIAQALMQSEKAIPLELVILYILRNMLLGAAAFFGAAIAEISSLKLRLADTSAKYNELKKIRFAADKEAKLKLKEADLQAKEIIGDAKRDLHAIINRKNDYEKRLKELIIAEMELIKKYEEKSDS